MKPLYLFSLLAVCLLLSFLSSLAFGSTSLADERFRDSILHLRLQRTVVAACAGAALAVAGVLTQALFRNPLAGPSVIGVNAGAALGGQLVLLCFGGLASVLSINVSESLYVMELLVPIGCCLGAGLSLFILLVGVRAASHAMVTILLIGVMLSSLFASLGALVTSLAQEEWELGRTIIYFSMGGLEGKAWHHVYFAAPFVLVGIIAAFLWSPALNVMLAGEDEARSLGVPVKKVRFWCLSWAAILSAMAVSIGGGVLFVGLIIPNVLRAWCRSDHRVLVPSAAIAGAAFVILCDVCTRIVPSVGIIPLGVITGLIGAPIFIVILIKQSRVYN